MSTTAKIRPSRASGVGGIFGGLLAVFLMAPFFYFVGSNVPIPHGELFCLFPVAIGLYSSSAGSSQVASRLAEIDALKNSVTITADEYAAKRQSILKDL